LRDPYGVFQILTGVDFAAAELESGIEAGGGVLEAEESDGVEAPDTRVGERGIPV
jgi:hypothetical protein